MPNHVGRLERVVDGQPPLGGIEVGQDGARLESDARVPPHGERVGHNGGRAFEGGLNITRAELECEGEIVAELRVDHRRQRVERALGIRHGGQRLPFDAHPRDAVFGERAALRHHGRDGLALPRSLAGREGALHRRLHPLEMREGADPARADGRHVLTSDDRDHSGQRSRPSGVDRDDARMRVGAPHEGDVEHARQRHVIGKNATTGQESLRLRPDHALADIASALLDRGHVRPRDSAVLRTASTMAWYPVQRQ